MCLTVWYDPNGDTLAFELLWGLLVDEWAFRYHRNGSVKYSKVDDGEPRIGRPQKQIMHGNYPLPPDRIKEFLTFDTDIPEDVKEFVLGVLQSFLEWKNIVVMFGFTWLSQNLLLIGNSCNF